MGYLSLMVFQGILQLVSSVFVHRLRCSAFSSLRKCVLLKGKLLGSNTFEYLRNVLMVLDKMLNIKWGKICVFSK